MGEKKTTAKMTNAKVTAIYSGIIFTFITSIAYPIIKHVSPEMLETEREHEMMHDHAMKVALEFPSEINKRYKKDSMELYGVIRSLKNNMLLLKSKVRLISEENEHYKNIIEGMQVQIDFNTMATTRNSEAIYEEMDPRESQRCNLTYKETNGGDNWYLYNDWYESKGLYPATVRTECRLTITPSFRSTIRIR